jgi:hypothetical protein
VPSPYATITTQRDPAPFTAGREPHVIRAAEGKGYACSLDPLAEAIVEKRE